MDSFWRFIGFGTKRQRTDAPTTTTQQASFHPYPDQDREGQAALQARLKGPYVATHDTRFDTGSRKRPREEDEFDDITGFETSVGNGCTIGQLDCTNDDGEGDEFIQEDQSEDEGDSSEEDTSVDQEELLDLLDDAGLEVNSDNGSVSPHDSASQCAPDDDSREGTNDANEEDLSEEETDEELEDAPAYQGQQWAAQEELASREKVANYLETLEEHGRTEKQREDILSKRPWTPEEAFLFARLKARAFEAVFPATWHMDFPALPKKLFSRRENQFFNSNHTDAGSAIKAFERLFEVGVRVKDLAHDEQDPVPFMTREIKNFIKWAEMDGGYRGKRFIPNMTVISGKPSNNAITLTKSVRAQMNFLAEKYREHLALPPTIDETGKLVQRYRSEPPILYGMIIAKTFVFFTTLDSSIPGAFTRHIAAFDFKKDGFHVWNGMAVAIIVIMARNYLMSILDTLEDDDPESDPDA